MQGADLPRVKIVVLNWNGREDVLECLASLERLQYSDYGVIMVDNGSTDSSVESVQRVFPRVTVLETGANLGFAAGVNMGLERALADGADYALVLNNDTVATDEGFLSKLVDFAESHPRACPVSPQILYYQSGITWFAGGRLSYLTGFARHMEKGSPGARRSAVPFEVDYVSGCCMLLSKEFLDEVGFFYPRYFLYYEDVDLCFRGARAGFGSYVVPTSVIEHKKSASAGVRGENRLSALQAYFFATNALVFAEQNLSGWRKAAFIVAQLTVRLFFNMFMVSSVKAAREYLRGLRDGLIYLRKKT